MAIALGEQVLEQGARRVRAPDGRQCIDQPECADHECIAGRAEVVLFQIAKDVVAALQFSFNDLDRGDEAGVVRRGEIEFSEQEQARVRFRTPD